MRFSVFLPVLLVLASCQPRGERPHTAPAAGHHPVFDYSRLEGVYRGDFGAAGDIRIVLRHVTAKQAVGYNLHRGLKRNLSGTVQHTDTGIVLVLNEPGDNPFDGIFTVTMDTAARSMNGSWAPANRKQLAPKSIALVRLPGASAGEESYSEYEFMRDTAGDYDFQPDGMVIYRYYPADTSGKRAQQYQEIKGNWREDSGRYIIEWQPNTQFPGNRSSFRKMRYSDDNEYFYLEGEGRRIEPALGG